MKSIKKLITISSKTVLTCILTSLCIQPLSLASTQTSTPSRSERTALKPLFGPTTITEAGVYKLAQNITGPLTISANNVYIDLNGYAILNSSNNTHGIAITANTGHVTIRNGSIGLITSGNGINIASGCFDIIIELMRIYQCSIGINANTTNDLQILTSIITSNTNEGIKASSCLRCLLSSNTLSLNTIGASLISCNDCQIQDCTVTSSTSRGISLTSCNRCICSKSKTFLTGSNASAYGFISTSGSKNSFFQCSADQTITTATSISNIAAGFFLSNTENSSSIIECTANGTETPSNGQATAYGICLEGTLITPNRVAFGDIGGTVNTIKWAPNNKHLAIGTNTGPSTGQLFPLEFNKKTNTLMTLDAVSHTNNIYHVDWGKNNGLLAFAGETATNDIKVYKFDEPAAILTLAGQAARTNKGYCVAWTPDENFLVGGGEVVSGKAFALYQYSKINATLTKKVDVNHNAKTLSMQFDPSGRFLAVGGETKSGSQIFIHELDYAAKTLTERDTKAHGAQVNAVAWSPNGKYLAIAGASGTGSYDTRLYEFNSSTKLLTLRDSKTHGATVNTISWALDSAYCVTGGATASANEIRIYSVNPTSQLLTLMHSIAHGAMVNSVSWSPNPEYIAIGGSLFSGATHSIYKVMQFPSNCMLSQNIIYGTTGNSTQSSIGLAASESSNLIISNTAYRNDINYMYLFNSISTANSTTTTGSIQLNNNAR